MTFLAIYYFACVQRVHFIDVTVYNNNAGRLGHCAVGYSWRPRTESSHVFFPSGYVGCNLILVFRTFMLFTFRYWCILADFMKTDISSLADICTLECRNTMLHMKYE